MNLSLARGVQAAATSFGSSAQGEEGYSASGSSPASPSSPLRTWAEWSSITAQSPWRIPSAKRTLRTWRRRPWQVTKCLLEHDDLMQTQSPRRSQRGPEDRWQPGMFRHRCLPERRPGKILTAILRCMRCKACSFGIPMQSLLKNELLWVASVEESRPFQFGSFQCAGGGWVPSKQL